ncbi:bifunctional [glutamine synthetase] adenylyltransferase/[glutamine synthetase]-adenylyl-L-tyrosine phosphorylase [Nesterenkonia alba]|uniref:bifunctional [glutamine synthetase] adenylyltransferase/[glutamine synthetase]-adenylyl-L-tyrosine phosphorylase n=1 Tax=Nesterenkonia alba TaxID=515814 RepID=UPI0003B652A0|nr:bifunctional [glutamine synthetase] adenylyltransferase/[glutamine synthetase]-adenylyl-L-tyrosine phosphorylase [Nesterenkonia alba]
MAEPAARELIASGFQEIERAQAFFQDPQLAGLDAGELAGLLKHSPDPDQALLLLIRLCERAPSAREIVAHGGECAVGLLRLLGASQALGEFLIRHPECIEVVTEARREDASAQDLREVFFAAVDADAEAERPTAALSEDFTAEDAGLRLRVAYRREILALALRDLTAEDPLAYQPLASRQLADAAAGVIDAALAVARAEVQARRQEAEQVDLAVIGMGKCGARELNYVSDVDVIFVHAAPDGLDADAAQTAAVDLAAGISKVLGSARGEPGLWEVDANLRPEGRDGPLSRTLDSHREYYARWAHGWEYQALLKARPIAGHAQLGADYMAAVEPLVWQSSTREGFVADVQAMRRRVYDNIPASHADREIKLGRGGLRDIEFTVQLLQLVHGRVDESIRAKDTLTAIEALQVGEYVSSADAEQMSRAYRQLRLIEHRIQMTNMRRTHLMPEKEETLRSLANAVRPPGESRRATGEELVSLWRSTARDVAGFHERIFYRPLLSTTAVLSDDEVRLSAEAAQARLSALGYSDAAGAVRHIEALTSGVSRRATLQRRVLPAMLGWLADGVDPDGGLVAFRRLSDSLGKSPWYMTMLRDSSVAAERLATILSGSRFIADMLEHSPEAAKWLGDDAELKPRSFEALWTEVQNSLARHEGEAETAVRLVRLIRLREVLRTAVAEAVGVIEVDAAGRALAEADRVATLGALRVAEEEIFAGEGQKTRFLVVAMGRQGGREIGYGSDMDAMFVHRPVAEDPSGQQQAEAAQQAQKLAQRLRQLLSAPVKPAVRGEYPLQLDVDLRPEGKSGPLSRSLESYEEYYHRWMEVWERQALLRARPVAGCPQLAEDFQALIDPIRYGPAPTASQVREIRRIKARVESERLPRGADPTRHVKLGRGGLSDVEWMVQLLQLQHAHEVPKLRTTSTLGALNALIDEQILGPYDAGVLAEAWTLCTRVRSGNKIWSGRLSDVLPTARRDLEAVSRWCGFGPGQASEFEEHYLRTTRRARQVYERLFYED